jgi:hypothetical protein
MTAPALHLSVVIMWGFSTYFRTPFLSAGFNDCFDEVNPCGKSNLLLRSGEMVEKCNLFYENKKQSEAEEMK